MTWLPFQKIKFIVGLFNNYVTHLGKAKAKLSVYDLITFGSKVVFYCYRGGGGGREVDFTR